MAIPHSVQGVQIGNHVFPPSVIPPGSGDTLFLGGAGVRGLEIENKFILFTVIGIYLEATAIPSLAVKWKGKTAQELSNSPDFYTDIYAGRFEKLTQVIMIMPLTGRQYSEKVAENCVTYLKEVGSYGNAEIKAIKKFLKIFKKETLAPGSSILFTHSRHGSLHIAFSKDASIPRVANATIVNKQLCEAVLESIIGKNGVSPQAKQSLAERISGFLAKVNAADSETTDLVKTRIVVQVN